MTELAKTETWWYQERKHLTQVDFKPNYDLRLKDLLEKAVEVKSNPEWFFFQELRGGEDRLTDEDIDNELKMFAAIARQLDEQKDVEKLSPVTDEANS